MGKNAARMTDAHFCAQGGSGQIQPDCMPRVLVGGLPAARVTDVCECLGRTDAIIRGIRSVKIGRQDAATLCSRVQNVGLIYTGCANVHIGALAFAVQARANGSPTPEQLEEINQAIREQRFEDALEAVMWAYEIETDNASEVVYDSSITNEHNGFCRFSDGRIRLGPNAFSSPHQIASTVVHESTHSNQAALLREGGHQGWLDNDTTRGNDNPHEHYDEAVAYDSELQMAAITGLDQDPEAMQRTITNREYEIDNMGPEGIMAFCSGGYPG